MYKFAHRVHLLHDLAAKPRDEYKWTDKHEAQFEDLKYALTSAPLPDADFILRTDASDTVIGGVLCQKQLIEGKLQERPLGYFYRKPHGILPMTASSSLLVPTSRCYVHGRRHTTIYTDHAALQHILGQNKLTSRQWRHFDKLQQHDYDVKYFPGAANVVAGALSRIAYTQPSGILQSPQTTLSLVNVVELHISASEEWLNDVRKVYPGDSILGPVVGYLREESAVPDTKQHRRVKERAKTYRLEDGLLYHKPSGKLCIPAPL